MKLWLLDSDTANVGMIVNIAVSLSGCPIRGSVTTPVPLQPHLLGTTLGPASNQPRMWTSYSPPVVLPSPLGCPQLQMPNPFPSPLHTAPFTLVFVSGQITTCFGCRSSFLKPAVAPFNVVVQHKDYRSYTAPDGTSRQRYGNVYYHPNISCITVKQPQFHPANLVVSQQVIEKATQAHSDYLQAMLGVSLVIPSVSSS